MCPFVFAEQRQEHRDRHSVAESVAKAVAMLNSTRAQRSQRILVPLLVGSGRTPCCMLKNFDANMRSANPNVDIIVFSIGNAAAGDAASCVLPNVHYMALHEHWGPKRRGSATKANLWSYPSVDSNYRCASCCKRCGIAGCCSGC